MFSGQCVSGFVFACTKKEHGCILLQVKSADEKESPGHCQTYKSRHMLPLVIPQKIDVVTIYALVSVWTT